MKLVHFCAALALAAVAVFAIATPAAAIIQSNTGVVALDAPLPAAGAEFNGQRVASTEPDGQIIVGWGAIVAELLDQAYLIFFGIALYLLRRLPKVAVDALNALAGLLGQGRVDQLLEKAVQYGINATKGAVAGRTLTVPVGNEVLERAFEYALRHAPRLVSWAGGAIALREKIIARLNLEEDAAVPTPKPPADQLIREIEPAAAP